eukprot:403333660
MRHRRNKSSSSSDSDSSKRSRSSSSDLSEKSKDHRKERGRSQSSTKKSKSHSRDKRQIKNDVLISIIVDPIAVTEKIGKSEAVEVIEIVERKDQGINIQFTNISNRDKNHRHSHHHKSHHSRKISASPKHNQDDKDKSRRQISRSRSNDRHRENVNDRDRYRHHHKNEYSRYKRDDRERGRDRESRERDDRRRREADKVKKGRGFMRMNANTAMRGWEEDDYDQNQKKLKDLAEKLSGRNRQEKVTEPIKKEEPVKPTIHDDIEMMEKQHQSRGSSVERLRHKASSKERDQNRWLHDKHNQESPFASDRSRSRSNSR